MTIKSQRQMLIKPEFLKDVKKLPPRDVVQIMEKIDLLIANPLPDSKNKIQLRRFPGRPYRLRAGVYRIFYNFNDRAVLIFKIDRRSNDTYDDDLKGEEVPDIEDEDFYAPSNISVDSLQYSTKNKKEEADDVHPLKKEITQKLSFPLPEPITADLLAKLEIPVEDHAALLQVTGEDDIFELPGIDDASRIKIHDYLFGRPLIEVVRQPSMVVRQLSDIQRYREGELDLVSFLLQLDDEQKKFASWSPKAKGPTLVKGGPGTGKSTIALYRIHSFLEQLDQYFSIKKCVPKILFTTYTATLVRSIQQLLQQLLGEKAGYVQVDTADNIALSILIETGNSQRLALSTDQELLRITRQALIEARLPGKPAYQQMQKQSLERIGIDYLLEEFTTVIVARQLKTLDMYQRTPRAGRKVRLAPTQRIAIWHVYERWAGILQDLKKECWQQRRERAQVVVARSSLAHAYDAIIIDEAQDLDTSMLRTLVHLSKAPEGIVITADANQSIYGNGFSWTEVHEYLRFHGRTHILRTNYRSTAEIGKASQSYLAGAELESEKIEHDYAYKGIKPEVFQADNLVHEAYLLAEYFPAISRRFSHTLSSCAVLCPNESVGHLLASELTRNGFKAIFMTGTDLDLSQTGIKVLTLQDAKGLEFPFVALAGFTGYNYPPIPHNARPEEREEALSRGRRTIFVGMTRAMRALLVIVPYNTHNPLLHLHNFNEHHWTIHPTS